MTFAKKKNPGVFKKMAFAKTVFLQKCDFFFTVSFLD